MKTFNLAITSNIINETLTKNKVKPECSNKDCANSIFGKKKYNYLLDDDDNKKATLTLPPSSPTNTSNTMQCCCSALTPIENKAQIKKINRRNSPAKTLTKIVKDKKSITTENIVGLAMTKCSLETLENSISLKSDIDTHAQVSLQQSPTTSKPHDKSLTKGNHLMKKALVVEKLKSTNCVIARKLFTSTKRAIAITPNSNNSIDKNKETPKTPDSTDLDGDTTNTNTTTTTATVTTSHKDNDNDTDKVKVKEESQSMITSLLRTTTL